MAVEPETAQDREEWLSLGKAAGRLGIHSMTLRRWSDSGRFPSYRTAGGHRRFALSDIEAYLAHSKSEPSQELTDIWASSALVTTRRQVAHHDQHRWLKTIDDEGLRDEYRELGHQLMGLLLQHVAVEEPEPALLEEATRIGRRYGKYGKSAGLSLTSMLEATLFFRDILVESSLNVPPPAAFRSDSSLRILRRVNQVINTIQLSISGYYEHFRHTPDDVID